eukprot:Skav229747  [mRNA]  locus=scaffold6303:12131:12825:- [translate_table: standard]
MEHAEPSEAWRTRFLTLITLLARMSYRQLQDADQEIRRILSTTEETPTMRPTAADSSLPMNSVCPWHPQMSLNVCYRRITAERNRQLSSSGYYTPLQTAAYYGYAEMTMSLLRSAANVNLRSPLLKHTKVTAYENQRQWWYGQETSLHFASGRGHLQVVALLLEFEADVGILDARGRSWIDVRSSLPLVLKVFC